MKELSSTYLVLYYYRRVSHLPSTVDDAGAATFELLQDLRSWEVPAWVEGALLRYLHWRTTSLERKYKVRDTSYYYRRLTTGWSP
jgi:hypothetical protein